MLRYLGFSRKLVLAKMARLFTTARSLKSLQPRKEPRHGHGRRFVAGSQEVDRAAGLKDSTKLLVIRVVVAFLLHAGRMSCLRRPELCAARLDIELRSAAFSRGRVGGSSISTPSCGRDCWNERMPTACSCTSSTPRWSLRQARKRKTPSAPATVSGGRAKGVATARYKHAQKNCHSFTMGLLITPSGIRIPFCKPYHDTRVLQEEGPGTPHHSRGGSRSDSRTAAAGRGACHRAG